MARGKRTPSAIKKLNGTFREREAVNNEMNVPMLDHEAIETPAGLVNNFATTEWLKVTKILSSLEMLAETDTSLLLAYCNEMGKYFEANEHLKENGMTIITKSGEKISPLVVISNSALQNAIKIADKFGFNPASRTKIETPVKKTNDFFDDL
jgi:P27 family predicted phage terminase small subunit